MRFCPMCFVSPFSEDYCNSIKKMHVYFSFWSQLLSLKDLECWTHNQLHQIFQRILSYSHRNDTTRLWQNRTWWEFFRDSCMCNDYSCDYEVARRALVRLSAFIKALSSLLERHCFFCCRRALSAASTPLHPSTATWRVRPGLSASSTTCSSQAEGAPHASLVDVEHCLAQAAFRETAVQSPAHRHQGHIPTARWRCRLNKNNPADAQSALMKIICVLFSGWKGARLKWSRFSVRLRQFLQLEFKVDRSKSKKCHLSLS